MIIIVHERASGNQNAASAAGVHRSAGVMAGDTAADVT
jgi:hypothetical protein